jgi:hypothetical protein
MVDRDSTIFRERLAGRELADIGREHSISGERVRQIVVLEADRVLDQAERDLQEGGATGEWPTLAIPFGPGFDDAVDFARFLATGLRDRGHPVRVIYAPKLDCVALMLTLDGDVGETMEGL